MKLICLPLSLVAVTIVSACLFAAEPMTYDLDGRRVVVRVHQIREDQQAGYKVSTIIEGRTIRLDIPEANEETVFNIRAQDQNDPVLRQLVQNSSQGWSYRKSGLEYFIHYSAAELQARPVVLRLYLVNEKDPSNYRRVTTEVRTRRTEALIAGPEESGFLVIFGSDQTDPVMKRLFGTSVYGCPYNKSVRLRFPRVPEEDRTRYDWQVCNALAGPLGAAGADVYLRSGKLLLKLASVTADSQGRFSLPFCAASKAICSNLRCRLRFEVSAPGYCKNIIETYGSVKSGPLLTANVPAGSIAETRSVWGQVVDGNDNPVAGALVEPTGCIPPGAKWIGSSPYQLNWVVADLQGRFRAYLPVDESAYQIGTLIPPNTEYAIEVESPEGTCLAPFNGRILNGQYNKVTLDYAGYFHTFVFEDQEGPIKDPELLNEAEMYIERPGQRNLFFRYEQLKDGVTLPLGTYRAKAYGPRVYIEFQPLTVTAHSPERLVFRVPTGKTYYGRVIDGITGQPMAGAFVIAFNGYAERKNLSYLTAEQWAVLHALNATDSASDPNVKQALKPVTECYSLIKMERTDRHGWFRLAEPPKVAVRDIVAFEEGRLTIHVPKRWAELDKEGNYRFGDIRLFPAAMVMVKPVDEQGKNREWPLRFRPQWFLTAKDNPAWVQELLAACEKHPENGVRREFWLEANQQHCFQVPAGLSLRINLRVLHGVEWAPVTIADDVTLAQGEVFDAGEVQILSPFAVFVEVLDSAGRPLEGVPVTACGQHDPAVSSTDEQGVAVFEFVGYSKGEFIVKYDPEDDANQPVLHRSIPYEVAGVEDANSSYTIRVPDRLFNQILK